MQQQYAEKDAAREAERTQEALDAYEEEKRAWRRSDKSRWRSARVQDMLNRLDGGE